MRNPRIRHSWRGAELFLLALSLALIIAAAAHGQTSPPSPSPVRCPHPANPHRLHFECVGEALDFIQETLTQDWGLPYHAVLDPKARKLFSEERKIPLFKKKTLLYVQLRPETADDARPFDAHLLRPFPKGTRFYVELHPETPVGGKSDFAQIHDHSFDMLRVFATIELQNTLYLCLRGTKAPTLSETACRIPAFKNKEAHSVNHACTLLSQEIERHRISHTTNVFRTVCFLRRPDRLCPLDHMRHDRTVLFEGDLGESRVMAGLKKSGV